MRLQTAKHHVVRVFRLVAALLMLCLLGILSWNFALQPRLKIPEGLIPGNLPNNLSAHTDGLTFQHTSGNRTFYTLKAKTHDSFQDAPHVFRGVEVLVYGTEMDPDRRIESDECAYDPKSGDIEFKGHVVAQLDEKTTGRTDALSYRNKERLALSRSRIIVERPDEMTAAANTMEFGIDSGVLKLGGKVHATLASGAELDADAAVFHRNESWTTVSGHVLVKSLSGWVRGEEGRAELEPGAFRPTSITIHGNVTAESRSANSADVWELKRADRLDLAMSPSGGGVERAGAFGQARLEKRSASGTRSLTGGALVSWVNARGEVERVEATDSPRLEDRNGSQLTQLTAVKMLIDPAGTIITEGASRLDSGESTVIGQNFHIEQGDIARFTTTLPAIIDTKRPGAPPRHMQAERSTTARIDSKTNRLIEVVAMGAVQLTEGDRRGNADKITATEGGDTVILEGSATVIEPKTTVDAKRIEISEKGAAFKASGAVKTVSQSESAVTVTANNASGRSGGASDHISYVGNVVTTVKSSSGPLTITADKAETITAGKADGDSTEMTYTGNVDTVVQSESGLVRIKAATGTGNADKMTYTGGVELWRVRDNVHIQSDKLVVWTKDKRFNAEGNVQSQMDTLTGTSATLDYSDAPRQEAVYRGKVHLIKEGMIMDAAVVVATMAEGKLSEATADGAVTLVRGLSQGHGDHAVYNAGTDRAVLTGNPADISDQEKGITKGMTLTMDVARKNVVINGASETTPNGRVKTQTKIRQ